MRRFIQLLFGTVAFLLVMLSAWGQSGGGSLVTRDDCTEAEINYEDDSALTQAEKLALMEQAFQESLSRYSHCQNSSGGGGGGAQESSASLSISGTEKDVAADSDADATASTAVAGTESPQVENKSVMQDNNAKTGDQTALGQNPGQLTNNGKAPEDIPPADNDSIVEAQIRAAAIAEQDTQAKAALWNEYRKYKGLPIKNEENSNEQ